jgi:transcriptional regulator with XRE-family HTH domain
MDLHWRLARWREAKGWTQQELADRIGVSRTAVTQWESGRTTPTANNLAAVASILGVSMERFYGRVPERVR